MTYKKNTVKRIQLDSFKQIEQIESNEILEKKLNYVLHKQGEELNPLVKIFFRLWKILKFAYLLLRKTIIKAFNSGFAKTILRVNGCL